MSTSTRREIIEAAIKMASRMPPDHYTQAFVMHFPTHDMLEAQALAGALVYANNAEASRKGLVKEPLSKLIASQSSYDPNMHQMSVTLYTNKNPNAKNWADFSRAIVSELEEYRQYYRPSDNPMEEVEFYRRVRSLEINPKPEYATHFFPMQASLFQLLARHHGRENISLKIKGGPTVVGTTLAHPALVAAVSAGLGQDRYLLSSSEIGGVNVTMIEKQAVAQGLHKPARKTNPEKALRKQKKEQQEASERQATTLRRRDEARQPQSYSIDPLKILLNNLENSAPRDCGEEYTILAHAVRKLAAAVDVRSNAVLETAAYGAEELTAAKQKVSVQRKLAEMLLSADNIEAAMQACQAARRPNGNGKAGNNGTHSEKIISKRGGEKNAKFLRDTMDARIFLEEKAKTIPGLVFLVQAATLSNGDLKKQAADLWKRRDRNRNGKTLDTILRHEPQLWGPACERLMDQITGVGSPG